MPRDQIRMVCQTCKRKNYATTKNKRRTPDKLEFKKFCNYCRVHTVHREGK